MEPRGVGHGVHADVRPRRVAVLVRLGRQDVKDGQQEADQPASTHPKQSLRFVIRYTIECVKSGANTKTSSIPIRPAKELMFSPVSAQLSALN